MPRIITIKAISKPLICGDIILVFFHIVGFKGSNVLGLY
jgi:hypothetical protein